MTQIKYEPSEDQIPVRRRNSRGSKLVNITITIPAELNHRLEEKMKQRRDSKSLVATVLMETALDAEKGE